jgi:hypothetical protein
MKEDTCLALSDRFACLRDVASLGSRDPERDVRGLVREMGIEEHQARDVVDFWGEEFVVE